jgi:hypothetical protein
MSSNSPERRKSERREILDNFSFYICVPKLGFTRHTVNDVSETGIGITISTMGEIKLKDGEECELHLYLNQSLYLPLQIKVMRERDSEETQLVGAQFMNTESKEFKTYLTLVKLLDQLVDAGVGAQP